jgi:PKD domain-containing protein
VGVTLAAYSSDAAERGRRILRIMRLARSAPSKRAPAAFAYVAATAFLGIAATGCGSEEASSPHSASGRTIGSAELSLTLPNSTTISTVGYKITHSNGYLSDGSVPVANSEAITFQIGNIPAALGYKIELTASTSGSDGCKAGPMPFDITGGQTSLIAMTLRCGSGSSGSKSGNVRVDVDVETSGGSGNGCAVVDGLTALPRSVKVGSTIDLRGYATSSSATFKWTVASGGSFSSASSAMTTFKCESAGTHTVTLSVTGSGSCSASTAEIPLICTSGSSTGGAGASGAGAGAGGAGAGGAGAGGTGTSGTGASGTGASGTGASGTGASGTGASGTGASGTGASGTGASGTGASGTGASGTGASGTGASGTGASGTGASGTGASGTGASGTGGGGPSAACTACRNTNCRDYQGSGLDLVAGCYESINTSLGATAGDATFLQQCQDFLGCAKTGNCAYGVNGASDCYCGSAAPDACIKDGPASDAKCVPQTKAATRTESNADITVRFSDLAFPMGWAYFLLECDRDNCLSVCGPGT